MERFKQTKSLAGILQPGDGTRYEMVAVETFDTIEVIVCNDSFFDQIVFSKDSSEPYFTRRGENTNPWTIKAALEMKNKLEYGIHWTPTEVK
jgi:hypothetical protein